MDWSSRDNTLLLNPRLPQDRLGRFTQAWETQVEPHFHSQVGIATSGTSGDGIGKLVVIGKDALLASARAVNERFGVQSKDVWMKSLPDFHVGGLGVRARAYSSQSRIAESQLEKWEPLSIHRELEESGATLVSMVPTQIFDLVQARLRAPAALRAVIVGGGRLESLLLERARELGWPVYPSYGLTESASQIATAISVDDARLTPLSHIEMRTEGESGRLALKGSSLLTGYVHLDESGARFEDPKREGWFLTEDRACLSEDGSLEVLGRIQDFVKIGGEGVVVSRLQSLFETLRIEAGVNVAAVLLVASDERLGARIIVVHEPGLSEIDRLVSEYNSRVAPFERVRDVRRIDEIPRTTLGKIRSSETLALVGFEALAHDLR
jgi:o-succinylbenzoate---CoA ligase